MRWQGVRALLWTAITPEEWRETCRLWSLELTSERVAAEVEEILKIVATKAAFSFAVTQESIQFMLVSLDAKPQLVSKKALYDALTLWTVGPQSQPRLAFDAAIRILDLSQDPGEAAQALRQHQKGVYWFLGDYFQELSTGAENAGEASLAYLQLGASYSDWPTRVVSATSLSKLALCSDDHMRTRIHDFFRHLLSEPGGEGGFPLLHPVMHLIERVSAQKAALRTRLATEKEWAPQELKVLAQEHQSLTNSIKNHCPRLPAHFFPLGAESEALIALAGLSGAKK